MESTKTLCRGCALQGIERKGFEVKHVCKRTGQPRPYCVTQCEHRKVNY